MQRDGASVAKAGDQNRAMIEEVKTVDAVDTPAAGEVVNSVDAPSQISAAGEAHSADTANAASAQHTPKVPPAGFEGRSIDAVDAATSRKRGSQRDPDQPPAAGSAAKRARQQRERKAWRQKERAEGSTSAAAPSDAAPSGDVSEKQVTPRPTRAEVKAAELADFRARAETGATVVLDLEWEACLSGKELTRVVQQVLFSYGMNRTAKKPVRLVISGVRPGGEMAAKLKKLSGFDGWPVTVSERPYVDLFSKDQFVYVCADAADAVTSFDGDRVYVIAGLIDDAKFRGRPLQKATGQGISALRLPIAEHVDLGTQGKTPAITMSQTLQAVLEFQRLGDWPRALEKIPPMQELAGKS